MSRGASLPASALELWAGVECTVNRVGEEFYDQLERNGHAARIADLNLFAALGVRSLRYPVLWERTAPEGLEHADWSWPDARLTRLRELNIRPIVGLLHHGSGPRHTSLVASDFPVQLAEYARAVAERYPWVDAYTPVNEPLTTARFSGLYGHWYPHGRDAATFARALVNQCRATALAMRAIREINPHAQLIQTEDLGKTFSTRALRYQADFENVRRWMSLDLLCGRITREHPMWSYLTRVASVGELELEWFNAHPCLPDVIGINHYLTSERFLDERVERYPDRAVGGNGRHRYVDMEAVRVCAEGTAGARVLLREAWERYGIPLAVTEAHLGCTREEQMRWFKEVWDAAQSVRADGVDLRAVTAWSLLGSFDWCSLLTRRNGKYEPGVFDVRCSGGVPRPTALARMLRDLAAEGEHSHPALDSPGWWRRLERLQYPPVRRQPAATKALTSKQGLDMRRGNARPLIINGATGTLGRAFARLCERRGLSYRLLTRAEMDIADPLSVEHALAEFEPWAVVNTAGYVRVDDAEREAEKCFRENAEGAATLAAACARRGVALLTFSSDLVFDGAKESPYVESDAVSPLNVYGRSKGEAERLVFAELPSALVVRTSAFFGPWDEHNFITAALRALAEGRKFVAADDALISPTYVPDLVGASLDILIDGEQGIWHLSNEGAITWAELARLAARRAGLDAGLVEARPTALMQHVAPRPLYSVLASARGQLLPTLEDALERYLNERETRFAAMSAAAGQQERAG
ncbi:MAG TPA: family 1 glycosylhydrolase [Pyrinomonadaceae bacterium]|jgi:dTDP-4-dehydrorhamnose reductase|nr:family 1 glycosylhydrolase [Pyrinomonadaceae bacterium]